MDVSDNTTEVWRPVLEWEGRYEVSNLGRVRSLSAQGTIIMKFHKGRKYPTVTLSQIKGVHTLVAESFISPRPPNLVCNHKDGNPKNNSPDNLEWVCQKENVAHSLRLGLTPTGSRHWSRTQPERWKSRRLFRKLSDTDVIAIRELSSKGIKDKAIGKMYGICREHIRDIRLRKARR